MGMSTHVDGIVPPDEKWQKMKAIYDACEAAGVSTPEEVADFFGGVAPDGKGVVVPLERLACCKRYGADMVDGFEVDVRQLPANVKIIRFTNSY